MSAGESAIRAYQAEAGLDADGVRGPETRAALLADDLARDVPELAGFRGSLGALVRGEGLRGRPYWPGSTSGVTLDCGWDLGRQGVEDLRRLYAGVWPGPALDALCGAIGLRGSAARTWLLRMQGEWSWPIRWDQAGAILPRAVAPYWAAAETACPTLRQAPARVQSALLSVAYSAWIGPVLKARDRIAVGDWASVAAIVRASAGDPRRREHEADLIANT